MKTDVDFKMLPQKQILRNHGFGKNGKLQKFADVRIVTLMEPYVPFKQGRLRGTAKSSDFGSGLIVYKTPYARRQFFEGRKAGTKSRALLEGRRWDKRFESDKSSVVAKEIERYGNTI